MLKFKAGDKVRVMLGKDRGREGTIDQVLSKEGKAIISGINMYKKHIKKAVARDGKGGVYEIARPIDLSKLSIIDPKSGKPTRVGFKVEGGKKLRISKKSGVLLDTK